MLRAVVDVSELLSNSSAWVVFLQFHTALVGNDSLTRMFQHLLAHASTTGALQAVIKAKAWFEVSLPWLT